MSLLLSEAAENSRNLYNFGHFHRALRTGGPDFTRFGEEFFDITIEGPRSGCVGSCCGEEIYVWLPVGGEGNSLRLVVWL